MSLIDILNNFRRDPPEMNDFDLQYGAKWFNEIIHSGLLIRRANQSSYWTDRNGNRTTNYRERVNRGAEWHRSVAIGIRDRTISSRYHRSSSKICRISHEMKSLNDTTVLVKRTLTVWKIPPSQTGNRYSAVQTAEITNAMTATPTSTLDQLFLVSADAALVTPIHRSDYDILGPKLGLTTEHTINWQQVNATKTKPSSLTAGFKVGPGSIGKIRSIELRGLDAKIWNATEVSDREIRAIINPSQVTTYSIPTIKRKKVKWNIDENESLSLGALIFTKLDQKPTVAIGDTLFDAFTSQGKDIVCSIPEKCLLNYPKNGKMVSTEIEPGVYALVVEGMQGKDIAAARGMVLELLSHYRIEYDFNRMDFLSVIDIGNGGDQTEQEGSLGRVASIEDFDGHITSQDRSLLDRIND